MEKKDYEMAATITRAYNRAVHKAQKENHKNGLPNIFFNNGQIVYELPNGKITVKSPQ